MFKNTINKGKNDIESMETPIPHTRVEKREAKRIGAVSSNTFLSLTWPPMKTCLILGALFSLSPQIAQNRLVRLKTAMIKIYL